ncbi:MAG: hypothetical protein AAGK37_07640 [Pseudomonadota bacterium]
MEAIYPSAAEIPENTLRLYVYFSAPIGETDVLAHIHLKNAAGQPVEGAFLSNRFDLWSPDRRRLTLLFDPGRVKTGLRAHEALGRALQAGQSFELGIDRALKDASGCPLAHSFSHTFHAGPEDFSTPDPALWQLDKPAAATDDPIEVHLAKPLDHVSLAYRLRITTATGDTVSGRIELGEGERTWRFYPNTPWIAQTYRLSVDPRLEDLAGNRPGERFDRLILDQPVDFVLHREFRIKNND